MAKFDAEPWPMMVAGPSSFVSGGGESPNWPWRWSKEATDCQVAFLRPRPARRVWARLHGARAAQPDGSGQFGTLGGVVGGDHRIVARQTVAGTVAVGIEPVACQCRLSVL